jgi:hypothetical protein
MQVLPQQRLGNQQHSRRIAVLLFMPTPALSPWDTGLRLARKNGADQPPATVARCPESLRWRAFTSVFQRHVHTEQHYCNGPLCRLTRCIRRSGLLRFSIDGDKCRQGRLRSFDLDGTKNTGCQGNRLCNPTPQRTAGRKAAPGAASATRCCFTKRKDCPAANCR